MRNFTKKHNDIEWLFPSNDNYYDSDKLYKTFESEGKHLFEVCYQNKKEFTEDDMIDAFMKGASVCLQRIYSRPRIVNEVDPKMLEECLTEIKHEISKNTDTVINLFNLKNHKI